MAETTYRTINRARANTLKIDEDEIRELIAHYESKRQIMTPGFRYKDSEVNRSHFYKTWLLCKKLEVPSLHAWVNFVYDRLGPARHMFSPTCLHAQGLEQAWLSHVENASADNAEVESLLNVDYAKVWDQCMGTLARLEKVHNLPAEDLLMNSAINLPAWFRVYAPEKLNMTILNKWGDAAKKQILGIPRLKKYVAASGLDDGRINFSC